MPKSQGGRGWLKVKDYPTDAVISATFYNFIHELDQFTAATDTINAYPIGFHTPSHEKSTYPYDYRYFIRLPVEGNLPIHKEDLDLINHYFKNQEEAFHDMYQRHILFCCNALGCGDEMYSVGTRPDKKQLLPLLDNDSTSTLDDSIDIDHHLTLSNVSLIFGGHVRDLSKLTKKRNVTVDQPPHYDGGRGEKESAYFYEHNLLYPMVSMVTIHEHQPRSVYFIDDPKAGKTEVRLEDNEVLFFDQFTIHGGVTFRKNRDKKMVPCIAFQFQLQALRL